MSAVAVEHARQQWAEGHRRLQPTRSTVRLYLRLLTRSGSSLAELNRRVGQTFTLAELADAYQ